MPGDKTYVDGEILTAANLNSYVRDQIVTICTSGTRPSSPTTSRFIFESDTGRLYSWNGAAWILYAGSWSSWSPTLTNVSIGNGTFVGYQSVRRGEVMISGKLTFGSTTTVSGAIQFSVPIVPALEVMIQVGAYDASANTGYVGWSNPSLAAGTTIFGHGVAGPWAAAVPFTWATGDFLWISGNYPI